MQRSRLVIPVSMILAWMMEAKRSSDSPDSGRCIVWIYAGVSYLTFSL